jgi:hypothetical protein
MARARRTSGDAWIVLVLLLAGSCIPVAGGALVVHVWP